MVFPRPFTRALYVYGAPLHVPREGLVEEWRGRVERALNDLAEEAEADFDTLWRGARR